MNESFSIEIENAMGDIASALDAVRVWLNQFEIPLKTHEFVSLAIEELSTNWFKYGCKDMGKHVMSFDLRLRDKNLILQVTDSGSPFNPMNFPFPTTNLPPEDRKPGSLGILLLRKSADHMSYEHRGGLNILTLEKSFC
ncbi:MAG: ATP-binding protein [Proteobacteria bacterium]|nr:ATP-binding protein [Pseudomonadota bacterium]